MLFYGVFPQPVQPLASDACDESESPHLTEKTEKRLNTSILWNYTDCWRRGRDSNPRYPFRYAGFQDRSHQPLATSPQGSGGTLDCTAKRVFPVSARAEKQPCTTRHVSARATYFCSGATARPFSAPPEPSPAEPKTNDRRPRGKRAVCAGTPQLRLTEMPVRDRSPAERWPSG